MAARCSGACDGAELHNAPVRRAALAACIGATLAGLNSPASALSPYAPVASTAAGKVAARGSRRAAAGLRATTLQQLPAPGRAGGANLSGHAP